MSGLTLPESINMLLDAHEPETDVTDQQLAAVRAATPSGDYFYADQCGRLLAIATSYQIRQRLLCKRLRELAAEEAVEAAAITTVCPVGDQIECPNCGETVYFDVDMVDSEEGLICPNCNAEIELDLPCGCGCGCEDCKEDDD